MSSMTDIIFMLLIFFMLTTTFNKPNVLQLTMPVKEKKIDHAKLFEVNRAATAKAIGKAMRGEPTIEWLLKNQESVTHCFHEMGVKGQL